MPIKPYDEYMEGWLAGVGKYPTDKAKRDAEGLYKKGFEAGQEAFAQALDYARKTFRD